MQIQYVSIGWGNYTLVRDYPTRTRTTFIALFLLIHYQGTQVLPLRARVV